MFICLARGSAIEITWNHWATLVKDLEAVAEKNRLDAAQAQAKTAVSTSPEDVKGSVATAQKNQKQKEEEAYYWERRPTWQRAAFCGIYVMGWALSTAWLLKYRQTYVTKLKFFRAPRDILTSTSTSSSATTTTNAVPGTNKKLKRMIHISTASNPSGITLPLSQLTIQDGRNETELVIRAKDVLDEQGKVKKRRREYWFVSLTDAIVDGARFGVESARDRVLYAWDGVGPSAGGGGNVGGKGKVGGWKSGPVVRD